MRDHLRLGKHGASRADGYNTVCFLVIFCEHIDTEFQDARHNIKKTPGARRAFVVHREILHFSVSVYRQRFCVLSTNIDHCANSGHKPHRAFCMATELADAFCGVLVCISSITGCNDAG
jgi:hypothetical protein